MDTATQAALAKLLFQAGVTPQDKIVWSSILPPAELYLLLGRIQMEIVSGQVKTQDPAIVPPSAGDVQAVNDSKNRVPSA